MGCLSPLKGYRSRKINKDTGKYPITFKPSKNSYTDVDGLFIPCGVCEGCRLARSFQWSCRCCLEMLTCSECYMLNLTYDNDHLPEDKGLRRSHFQSFMKRLRYYFPDSKIRVFYCGEYGDNRRRPHYHAIVFNLPLKARYIPMFYVSNSKKNNPLYACPLIEKIWGQGMVRIGSVTRKSCSYVAQYTLKKNKSLNSYCEKRGIAKPFVGASSRPALGRRFFEKYFLDIYNRGFFAPFPDEPKKVVRPLKYFDYLLEKLYPILYIKFVRIPREIYFRKERLKKLYNPELWTEEYASKLQQRIKREKRILRKLEQRLDM